MQRQTLKRYIAYSLLFASFMLAASSAKSQDRKTLPINDGQIVTKGDCPNPIHLTINAMPAMSFDPADFSTAQINAHHMTKLGDPSFDHNFLYTFQWKRGERCCQITRAQLTVVLKANLLGQSKTDSLAGNDMIDIMFNKLVVPPYNEHVYSNWPFLVGQTVTKQWLSLNALELSHINQSGRLSFAVEDDTQVVSATLELWGCCLTTTPNEGEESTTTGSAELSKQ